jgi:hypothetical protein
MRRLQRRKERDRERLDSLVFVWEGGFDLTQASGGGRLWVTLNTSYSYFRALEMHNVNRTAVQQYNMTPSL